MRIILKMMILAYIGLNSLNVTSYEAAIQLRLMFMESSRDI